MKWFSHKIITISVASLITQNPLYIASSFIGSTFPDAIEGNYGRKITFKNHRQFSHWFVPYVLVGVTLFLYKTTRKGLTPEISSFITSGLFFCFGCLGHLLLDAFTGTIPGFNPKNRQKRWGKKVIKSDAKEFLITLLILFTALFLYKNGFGSPSF